MRVLLAVLFVLLCQLSASGEEPLEVFAGTVTMRATRVALDPGDPARVRVGALTYLGGVRLSGSHPAFGGFSSMQVSGDRFALLSDGGR